MFGFFNQLLYTQNVNVARFARNVECDFFYGFQTPNIKFIDFRWVSMDFGAVGFCTNQQITIYVLKFNFSLKIGLKSPTAFQRGFSLQPSHCMNAVFKPVKQREKAKLMHSLLIGSLCNFDFFFQTLPDIQRRSKGRQTQLLRRKVVEREQHQMHIAKKKQSLSVINLDNSPRRCHLGNGKSLIPQVSFSVFQPE